MPNELVDVKNLFELCAALYAKLRLKKIRLRMNEKDLRGTKRVLANMARYLSMQQAHVTSLDIKMTFVYTKMGITAEFETLRQEGLLRSDAYNLKLSYYINVIGIVIAVNTFILTAMQIIQNYNYNGTDMNKCNCITDEVVIRELPLQIVRDCCHDPIIFVLCVMIAFLALLGLYHFVFLPSIRRIHKQLHREMEDEE